MTKSQRSVSRRGFVKSSLALTSAPFILPSHIWAAEEKPNDRLTLGFIGVGTQGRGLMGGLLGRKETQVVAVCDVDTNRREHAKKTVTDRYAKQTEAGTYKGCDEYGDFRELLARKDIDAVVIATPDHWHALIAIAAAGAGKDIYCEKPLCQSIREARAMVQAVRDNKRVFQTGSMQRSSKEFRIACELVQNGKIGKITKVDASVGPPGIPCNLPAEPDEPGLDWDMWLGPAPKRPYHSELSPRGVHKHFPNWRNYREYGGGMITDWGAHHFDIVQWGLGMDKSGPVEIIPPAEAKAKYGTKFVYANGVEATHKNGNGVWFYGSEGKIHVNRGKFELYIGEEKKAEHPAAREGTRLPGLDDVTREYLSNPAVTLYKSNDHAGDWLSCIKTRKQPICDVEIGARTVTVCHLVNLAYYHGARLKWNPEKNSFAEGTGKPEWLDIPHRDPWKLG